MSRFPSWHNPVPGWSPSRIDQGVDGTLTDKGFCAPFKCKVIRSVAYTPGWRGGWMVCEILYGPFTGQAFFVAEGAKSLFPAGHVIEKGGTRIAERQNNGYNNVFGNIECGWAAPNAAQPLSQTLSGYAGDQSVAAITAGTAFNIFIEQCGGQGGHNGSGHIPNWGLLPSKLRHALGV